MVQLSHPNMTTGKTIALTIRSCVGKVKNGFFLTENNTISIMPKLLWKNNKEPIFCFPREQILVLPSNGSYSRFHRCVVLLNFKFCVCVCLYLFIFKKPDIKCIPYILIWSIKCWDSVYWIWPLWLWRFSLAKWWIFISCLKLLIFPAQKMPSMMIAELKLTILPIHLISQT